MKLTRRLRQVPASSELPVILLSAAARQDDISRSLAAGADYYLTKPFNAAELLTCVQALLEPGQQPGRQAQRCCLA
ncbi:MAG: response regulator, partial [Streptosporangiaceae bacterium]